ncbi:MAG: class I SAM-dependent methyltransferase [Alphaproteobacteria bacterium]
MTSRTIHVTEPLYAYLLANGVREPDVLRRLRLETAPMRWSGMQIAPEQGQFMALLTELVGARRAIEVGTFTGYSALAVALALPEDGLLVACDINPETTAIGRRYWEEAGVAGRIDLRLAPAAETLQALIDAGQAGSFDLAFIDADKTGYLRYYEQCLTLVRSGGLIMIDNVLWGGKVADKTLSDEDTLAIRDLNRTLHADDRVSLSMVPVGDGLTLARKR